VARAARTAPTVLKVEWALEELSDCGYTEDTVFMLV
jgi:hypothetical protein